MWVVKLNANSLCSATSNKIAALKLLLKSRTRFGRAYPDIVAISEVDAPAGMAVNLSDMLGFELCRRYDIVWSLRSVDYDGLP